MARAAAVARSLARFFGRLKHGLLIQEILDRLARAGVRDLELRLFLGLGRRSPVGVDVRLWRRAPYLRTFWITRATRP